ncbi:DgyrCDS14383 [Dimorphilus gyrociliatus]|uniref:DgyrCDS14383 n=1 Tax=Dimorphilus gyrociliatus TaxID=2664684 RepID=A0A7I8WDE7_9ANNE|nr:DgyrCDS14383 [Dimorphilus gyrociliatus]
MLKVTMFGQFIILLKIIHLVSCEYHDYIIVGAGPSGLQMGSFLEDKKRDYVILERGNSSGTFFKTFPRHNTLISINKRFTGKTNKEFNFRHDWNSLISNDEALLFKEYSKDFFPDKGDYLQYLSDFEKKLGLNTRFNTNIISSRKIDNGTIELTDEKEVTFLCKYLIVATGIFKPLKVPFNGSEYVTFYDDMILDPHYYEGKNVLILGKGNTANEVATSLFPYANVVHMGSRSRVKLSWSTHYVGDLRAINNNILDNYQLKALDGIFEVDVRELSIFKRDDGRFMLEDPLLKVNVKDDNFSFRDPYDVIISCLGWIWDETPWVGLNLKKHRDQKLQKFPKINDMYEAVDNSNIYFTGVLTHSLDFKKSAGGFIHGYRYTTRALHRLLEWKNHGVVWPHQPAEPFNQLVPWIVKRVNEASAPYQMFQVLGDVIVINEKEETFEAYEEYPLTSLDEFEIRTGRNVTSVIVVVFEYGDGFSGEENDPFKYDRSAGSPEEAHLSNFLHPLLYYYKKLPTKSEMIMTKQPGNLKLPKPDRLHHVLEDFLTNFDTRYSHIVPLRRFVEHVLSKDLRSFSEEDCIQEAFTGLNVPHDCKAFYFKDFQFNLS